MIHHEEDNVSLRAADLKTKASPFNADRARCSPAHAILFPAGDIAFSIAGAKNEGALLESGNQYGARRAVKEFLRDRLIGRFHHLFESGRRLMKTLDAL